MPPLLTVKVVALMVAGSIASLKAATTAEVLATSVAPFIGFTEDTVGGVTSPSSPSYNFV